MQTMSKNKAQIKNLKSVETLGSANIICSDKTGTLTKGEMTCVEFRTISNLYKVNGLGYAPEGSIEPSPKTDVEARMFLAICEKNNEAELKYEEKTNEETKVKEGKWIASGNLTERALLTLARKAGIKNAYDILKENPFSSARKMASTIVKCQGGDEENYFPEETITLVKGAPNYIIDRVVSVSVDGKVRDVTEEDKKAINDQIDVYSSQAKRVLGLAYNTKSDTSLKDVELEKDLIWVGMAAIIDPPRGDVADAIAKCHTAGIDVRMITGDYAKTAEAIAKEIGLVPADSKELCIDCSVLHDLKDNQPKLEECILNTKVFARAQPEDKITIVSVLQSFGNICSMTGDGVNDAPALKKANIGVAMGITGTDAAKAAASMVLMDDSFASIVKAVEEGRRIYANIQKFCYFLLSTNIAEVFVILFASFIGLQSPLVPVQILWLNLMTDSLPALALANEGMEEMIMLRAPKAKNDPIIGKLMIVSIIAHTIVLTAVVLFTYIWALQHFTGDWSGYGVGVHSEILIRGAAEGIKKAQTCVIFVIVFAELLRAYTSRSLIASLPSLGVFSNSWLQYSVFSSIGLTFLVGVIPGVQEIFGMLPLDGEAWALVIGLSILPAILDEILKTVFRAIGFGVEVATEIVVRREKVEE